MQAKPSGIGKCSRTLGMSRGLGKGYLLSLALGKGSILGKGSPACPHKKQGLDVPMALEKNCPACSWGQSCGTGAHFHITGSSCMLGSSCRSWLCLGKGCKHGTQSCPACSCADYVEVAQSHMIAARHQSCGSGPFPHDFSTAACWAAYALEKAACALEKAN